MANVSVVQGLKAVGNLRGDGTTGRVRRYFVPASDNTALFIGDAVKSGGTSDPLTGLATITQAAAGDTLRGVVVAVDQVDGVAVGSTNISRRHRPASTAMYVMVNDDPDTIFEVQEDADVATTALIDIGENADIIVAAGNASTGLSGMQLDSSTHTPNSAQLRMLGFVQRPNNAPASANAKLLVVINEHELKSTSGV
jgi:hypothetical protein